MFIARANLMQVVKDLGLTENNFESYNSGAAAQFPIVMEQFIGSCVVTQGYEVADVFTTWQKYRRAYLKFCLISWDVTVWSWSVIRKCLPQKIIDFIRRNILHSEVAK